MSIRIPSDGSLATYSRGTFHIPHAGVVYLNRCDDADEVTVLPPHATGEVVDGELRVAGYGSKTHVFAPAKAVELKVKDEPLYSVAYVLSGVELRFKDEVYLLRTGNKPCHRLQDKVSAMLMGKDIQLFYHVGRMSFRHVFEYAGKGEELKTKRKLIESDLEAEFLPLERCVKVKYDNAGRALDLAGRALAAIKEMIDFESAMAEAAGTDEESVF